MDCVDVVSCFVTRVAIQEKAIPQSFPTSPPGKLVLDTAYIRTLPVPSGLISTLADCLLATVVRLAELAAVGCMKRCRDEAEAAAEPGPACGAAVAAELNAGLGVAEGAIGDSSAQIERARGTPRPR